MPRMNIKRAFCASIGLFGLCFSQAYAVSVSGQGTWETTLQARDLDGVISTTEAYYDTVLGITWLADPNYAMTSGYDADGLMIWSVADSWVAGLDINGFVDWRLPDISPIDGVAFNYTEANDGTTDLGFNISAPGTLYKYSTGNELAYMFYNTLGNLAYVDTSGAVQAGYGATNSGPFSDLAYFYWSGQVDTRYPTTNALGFGVDKGRQRSLTMDRFAFAWAVHPGDIGIAAIVTSPVPVPPAVWLFGSGLLGLAGIARRRSVA